MTPTLARLADREALVEPGEERAPALLCVAVLLWAHVAALLEGHLGATVTEVAEPDGDDFVPLLAGLIRDREHKTSLLDHFLVLARPMDLPPVRRGEHECA